MTKDYLDITVRELLEMRARLNKKLADKLGYEPEVGFLISFSDSYDDRISFNGGYPTISEGRVAHCWDTFDDPRDAHNHTAKCIDEYEVQTKADKVAALKAQIKALEGGA